MCSAPLTSLCIRFVLNQSVGRKGQGMDFTMKICAAFMCRTIQDVGGRHVHCAPLISPHSRFLFNLCGGSEAESCTVLSSRRLLHSGFELSQVHAANSDQ